MACYHKSVWLHPALEKGRLEAASALHTPASPDTLSRAFSSWNWSDFDRLFESSAFEEARKWLMAHWELALASDEECQHAYVWRLRQFSKTCFQEQIYSRFLDELLSASSSAPPLLSEFAQFLALVQGRPRSTPAPAPLMREFESFLQQPEHRLEAAIRRVKGLWPTDYLAGLETAAEASLKSGTGFSYLRLGDGEGRYLADWSPWPHLQEQVNETAKRVWFWTSETPPESFRQLCRESFANASFLGVHPEFRLRLEARYDLMGYMGCVAGNRWALETARPNHRLVPNWANVELDRGTGLGRLVAMARRVFTISGYPGSVMGDGLKKRFGLTGATHWQVPAEQHPALTDVTLRSPHYPDAFYATLNKLNEVGPGDLVLVGAGIFGKVYAAYAGKKGACALDVGSRVDSWNGIKIR